MTRRFDVGPLLVALAAVLLLVALFLDWYGRLSAWEAFEVVDVLLAVLGAGALVTAAGLVLPELEYMERRVLPWLVGAIVVLVSAELINPPPIAVDRPLHAGAWLAFGAACLMLLGAVLAFSRVSLAVAVEGRDRRRRVSAVDKRPPAADTGSMPAVGSRQAPTQSMQPPASRRNREEETPEA